MNGLERKQFGWLHPFLLQTQRDLTGRSVLHRSVESADVRQDRDHLAGGMAAVMSGHWDRATTQVGNSVRADIRHTSDCDDLGTAPYTGIDIVTFSACSHSFTCLTSYGSIVELRLLQITILVVPVDFLDTMLILQKILTPAFGFLAMRMTLILDRAVSSFDLIGDCKRPLECAIRPFTVFTPDLIGKAHVRNVVAIEIKIGFRINRLLPSDPEIHNVKKH